MGKGVQGDYEHQQHYARGVCFPHIESLARYGIEVHRERASGVEKALRHLRDGSAGENERGLFANDAADAEQNASEKPRRGGGQNHGEDGAHATGAESETAFAVEVGHGFERLFGRA